MLSSGTLNSPPIWHILTRLGEAEILIPAAGLTMVALMAQSQTRKLALNWMMLIVVATLLTLASKVAFIGWGLGWTEIDFTGVSGHAMFAAAIYPVLMSTVFSGASRGSRWLPVALGSALALMVAVSRISVGAHSVSEVVAGLIIGGSVSAGALALSEACASVIRPAVPILLLAWFSIAPFEMPASHTHSFVTRLALTVSGHETPFTRSRFMRHVLHSPPAAARRLS